MNVLFIIIIIVILFGIAKYFFNIDSFTNSNNKKKVMKYFGGDYCPHSNKDSRTYKLINEYFAKKYPGIKIEYYWIGLDTQEEFKKTNSEYVPTITNGNYQHIKLKIADNIKLDDHTDEELESLLLENIYNQL